LAQKSVIETEFGESLEWQELPGKKSARIAVFKHDVDPSNEKLLQASHAWMLEKMDRFRVVFRERIRGLVTISGDDDPED